MKDKKKIKKITKELKKAPAKHVTHPMAGLADHPHEDEKKKTLWQSFSDALKKLNA